MMTNFEKIYESLNLEQLQTIDEKLSVLMRWCKNHISQELTYSGTALEQYDGYITLANHFLDEFLPLLADDLLKPTPIFPQMNVLQYAAYCGYDQFLAQLDVSHTPLLNVGNEVGMTPLHFSALGGHVLATQILLNKGALPNQANQKAEFPLFSALIVPFLHDDDLLERKSRLFDVLKEAAPFTVNAVNNAGETVAHLMAEQGFARLMSDLIQTNQPLLFHNNNYSKYPIHTAILNNQLAIVRQLMLVPGMSALKDVDGRNALHYAAMYGDEAMLNACLLVDDLNDRDAEQKTPIILAAEFGNLVAIEALLKKGADSLLTDYQGLTMLDHAEQQDHSELVSWIIQNTTLKSNNTVIRID